MKDKIKEILTFRNVQTESENLTSGKGMKKEMEFFNKLKAVLRDSSENICYSLL